METNLISSENNYRHLGNTGINLSICGFGCAAAWGKSVMGKEMISDDDAQMLLEKAYLLGVNYFDTGFNYGFAEERLGRILKKTKVFKREDIVISTKFGEEYIDGKWIANWSPEWMKQSLYISMERMGITYVDMFMCHGGDSSCFSEELLGALFDLKTNGVVKSIGINTFDTDVIKWVTETGVFDFVFLDYNILKRERETLIDELYEKGIGVIAGAPLAQHLFSKDVFKIKGIKDVWYLARAFMNSRELMKKGKQYQFLNEVDGMTGAQIALKYVIDNPKVSSAVFGTTTLSHLEDNLKARAITIPESVLSRIRSI